MNKIILILLLIVSNSFANYISSGYGVNKGEAYLLAMSKAPSGNHWVLSDIRYGRGYTGYFCTVTWKQK